MQAEYLAPTKQGEISFINIEDLKQKAEQSIPKGGFGYISGGSGDEITLRRNTDSFNEKDIYPRVLEDLDNPNLGTEIFGIELPFPIITAPMAAHGLAHVSAERGTAEGTAKAGSIMAISTYSNDTIDDIAAAGGGAPQWFQLYLSKDDDFNSYILDDAVKNNMKAIILTVDATVGGNREADRRNNFKMPLPMANLEKLSAGKGLSIEQIFAKAKQNINTDDVHQIAEMTKLPVIVKGIQHPQDAIRAIEAGAAAVWVSNHGGRQLDGGPGSFEVLAEIAAAVGKKVPLIFDSGIRRGRHIFEAIASGADLVAVGRPFLYGLSQGGAEGVKDVYDFFAQELAMVMQLAGTKNIEDIKNIQLRQRRKQ